MNMLSLPARQWRIQKLLGTRAADAKLSVGPFQIVLGADMPCILLDDAHGATIGCLLGDPIDVVKQTYVTSGVRLPWPQGDITPTKFEAWISQLGGAFTALVSTSQWARIYPSAANSCVYEEGGSVAIAATPLALLGPRAYNERLDHELIDEMEIKLGGWLPAGLTAHHGVKRLLPNHFLDLSTGTVHRHWSGLAENCMDPQHGISQIAQLMQGALAAAHKRHELRVALTAGRDSRAVLAACCHLKNRVSAFTIDHDEVGPDLDLPKAMCRSLELEHKTLAQVLSTEPEQECWLMNSGHCVGGANLRLHRTLANFAPDSAVVTGAGGEAGRGFYWNTGDMPCAPLSAKRLLHRLDLKPAPQAVAAVQGWLTGLSGCSKLRILDLAYVELRMGCWSAPQTHGFPEICYHIAPLSHQRIFDILLSLPVDWRRSGCYASELITVMQPTLVAWPFNRYGWHRQIFYLGGKLMSHDRLRRKFRRHVLDRLSA